MRKYRYWIILLIPADHRSHGVIWPVQYIAPIRIKIVFQGVASSVHVCTQKPVKWSKEYWRRAVQTVGTEQWSSYRFLIPVWIPAREQRHLQGCPSVLKVNCWWRCNISLFWFPVVSQGDGLPLSRGSRGPKVGRNRASTTHPSDACSHTVQTEVWYCSETQ